MLQIILDVMLSESEASAFSPFTEADSSPAAQNDILPQSPSRRGLSESGRSTITFDSTRRSTGRNNVTGGCQCGAVRYDCAAAPVFTGNCHCRDCQRATGGAYVPAFAVPANAVKVTGEVKYYESRSDSGNTFNRGFCPTCGGRLFGKTSAFPQFMLITAGSLDDPSRFKPSMDFFTSSAQPWDHMNPDLPKFPKQPKV